MENKNKEHLEVLFQLKELSVALLKALREKRLKDLGRLMEARNKVLDEIKSWEEFPPEATPILKEILVIEKASERLAQEIKNKLLERTTSQTLH
ncbi:hypothetical protein [Thermosulfuriphilus sp.]